MQGLTDLDSPWVSKFTYWYQHVNGVKSNKFLKINCNILSIIIKSCGRLLSAFERNFNITDHNIKSNNNITYLGTRPGGNNWPQNKALIVF